jgi:hypothetical protein
VAVSWAFAAAAVSATATAKTVTSLQIDIGSLQTGVNFSCSGRSWQLQHNFNYNECCGSATGLAFGREI